MVEVAQVFQGFQIGMETVQGTPVAAGNRLLSLGIEPGWNAEITPFRATGRKYVVQAVLNKEYTVAPVTGIPTFSELQYVLSSIITNSAVNALGGGAFQWLFVTDPGGPDTVKTYTVEYGNDATGSRRFAGAIVRSLGIAFDRDNGLTLNGEVIGSAIEEGITLTTTPTVIPLVPILPARTSIYLDTDSGVIGTTKLSRVFSFDWRLNNKFNPVFPLDEAVGTGYAATVEVAPEHTFTLLMAHDAEGAANVTRLRAGTPVFVRVECTGAAIGGGNSYRLRIDLAGQVSAVARPSDRNGVYVCGWTHTALEDATWGNVATIELINAQAAL